jgi:hypothetical protein
MTQTEKIINVYKNIGSKTRAAEVLGISQGELDKILKENNISPADKNLKPILSYKGSIPVEPLSRQCFDYDIRVEQFFWKRMLEENGEIHL